MNDLAATPIEYLKGVGPQKAVLLQKELGIKTYGDLLYHMAPIDQSTSFSKV